MAKAVTAVGEAFVNGKSLINCELNIEVEQIDVTTMTEPDPNWTFIDAAGHFHAYTKDFALPTLKRVEMFVAVEPDTDDDDEPVAGELDEFWDEGEADYSYTELHCRICDENIVPGTRSTMGRKSVPGRKSWSVDVTGRTEDLWPLANATGLVSFWMESPKVFGVGMLLAKVTPVDMDGKLMSAIIRGEGELGTR